MNIRKATIDDLHALSEIFAQYRVFYRQPYEIEKAKEFLHKRLTNEDSVIFVAEENSKLTGFTQLYPSFTSVGMKEIWILNDLFVNENFRERGVAESLIKTTLNYSKTTGRKKVALSTGHTNEKAQRLYERLGFEKEDFYNYEKLTE